MYALLDEADKIAQSGRREVAVPPNDESYQLAFPVPIDAGQYRLRFAVADAKGGIGGVEQTVVAGLRKFGSLGVSDLLTVWTAADGQQRFLALERLPDSATTIGASLELYPDDTTHPPTDVIVEFALLKLGSQTPLVERSVTPSLAGRALTAVADIPVDDLAPGAYVIRATVLQDGVAAGTVSTTVRKLP
jgi:hypothetical protein